MAGQLVGLEGEQGEESSLAAEVLQVSGILAQEGAAKEGGQYIFQSEDVENIFGSSRFELTRDDTLHLIGLLNSPEVDIAKRELGVLLGRLERPAVEGLTRRLFGALRRRSTEIADLEDKAKGNSAQGTRRVTATRRPVRREEAPPVQQERRVVHAEVAPTQLVPPMGARSKSEEQLRSLPAHRSLGQGRQPPSRAPTMPLAEMTPPSPTPPPPPRPNRPSNSVVKREDLPEVFRRLTADTAFPSDEVIRGARATMTTPTQDAAPPPLTIGGVPCTESGQPQASVYLEALLEAHECETGIPATSSRRPLLNIDPDMHQSQRVPEEKAKEIFDRLYRSGKEHRVRRRVYHELGLLVEQAKEAQTCTFEPRVPLAAYPAGQPPEGSVTERLYREGLDRIRRREELMQSAPVPTFRPQTIATAAGMSLGLGRRQPSGMEEVEGNMGEDALGNESMGMEDPVGLVVEEDVLGPDEGMITNFEPPHVRLFREHQDRLERQRNRQEDGAEWRKYQFKPDLRKSQATGPRVVRSSSYAGLPQSLLEEDDFGQVPVRTAADEAANPSLAALADHALNTPRSEGNEGGVPEAEALLLIFSDSRMPVPDGFEEELLNGLALLGADFLGEVTLRLLDEDCIIAELQGPQEALTMLAELQLFELAVSGFRVAEVRWASAGRWSGEDPSAIQANQDLDPEAPDFGGASSNTTPPRSPRGGYQVAGATGHNASRGHHGGHVVSGAVYKEQAVMHGSGHQLPSPPHAIERQNSATYMQYVKPRGSQASLAISGVSEQGYTLSREASSTGFQSVAMMTPTSEAHGVQRLFSGRLSQAPMQQPVLAPGRGGLVAASGSGVRYPAELANMPSSLGNFPGPGSAVMSGSPRLSMAGAAAHSPQFAPQQQGSYGFQDSQMLGAQQGLGTFASPGYSYPPQYGHGAMGGQSMYQQPQRVSHPQVLRAGY